MKNESQFELTKIETIQQAYDENQELIQKIDARAEQKTTFLADKPIQNYQTDALSLAEEILEQESNLKENSESNYENEISEINKIQNEKERYSKLKDREEKYQTELKQKMLGNVNESEKDILLERIQLSENRLNEINSKDMNNLIFVAVYTFF